MTNTYSIGIVGHEAAKFTPAMEERAKDIIFEIIMRAWLPRMERGETVRIVSGGCHLGGIDIWSEEMANLLSIPTTIHLPKTKSWSGGYRERNLLIARDSDIVHCIVVNGYHSGYKGMRFKYCYHCNTNDHIKSGGCWTARRCKNNQWHIVEVEE